MEPCLVVSPHLDDAILSVGQFLSSWPGAHILTVFAGAPAEEVTLTSFDANSGYRSANEAVVGRWHEDDRACAVLGANPIRGSFPDSQYRDQAVDPTEIAKLIGHAADAIHARRIIGPVGLAHPDHLAVAAAFTTAVRGIDGDVWVYEDLPMRVEQPDLVPPALARFTNDGFTVRQEFIGAGRVEQKEEAVRCYRSQLWALNERCIYVPERTWRLR